MTAITKLSSRDLVLATDDAGHIVWEDNPELALSVATTERHHGLILGGLAHAEEGLIFIGLGIERDDMTEVHSNVPPGASSLEAIEQAIRALEVVRDGLRRVARD